MHSAEYGGFEPRSDIAIPFRSVLCLLSWDRVPENYYELRKYMGLDSGCLLSRLSGLAVTFENGSSYCHFFESPAGWSPVLVASGIRPIDGF